MPRETISVEINAPCTAVFETIHNYDCRLEWDTMLSKAQLLDGAKSADVGVRSVCVGTWRSLYLALETEYIRYDPGRVAAIQLINRPPFFEKFAATIQHIPISPSKSHTTYIYFFKARPQLIALFLEPLMNMLLKREIQMRLNSLCFFLERKFMR
ncbi:MAG: SRPBCC family protein [Anaerolineales bacterium]|nr:SRPBCC family protein [Anaerolineales bacterium]